MIRILKLTRWPNLLIIILTMYLIRYCIIALFAHSANLSFSLSDRHFFMLVCSVVLITAAGYAINDYFDTATDAINKPEKMVLGISMTPRKGMLLHFLFSITGISIGWFVSKQAGVTNLVFIHIMSVGLLWFYSSEFKRMFLIGNLVVALLTALVPLLPVMYEMPGLISQFKVQIAENQELFLTYPDITKAITHNLHMMWYWAAAYSGFAFFLTMAREIIKDTEDMMGDISIGSQTIPIRMGINFARSLSGFFVCLVCIPLFFLQYKMIASKDYFSIGYITLALQMPAAWFLYRLVNANTSSDYHYLSRIIKLIMLLGLLFLLVYWFRER